jgi:hydrogenase nickel incorporation protein HypB
VEIPIVENVRKVSEEIAAQNRERLREAGVATINLMGSPGCGKTTLLERTLRTLDAELCVGVVTGDLTTVRDAERIAPLTPHVSQINTGRGCHLDANQVRKALGFLPLAELDLLVIENVGNLICPVGTDLGQDARVGMFSVPEGDDKPAKHPYLVLEADVLVLNKIDLLPHVPFDLAVFERDVSSIREDVDLIRMSAVTGEGFESWLDWLRSLARTARK